MHGGVPGCGESVYATQNRDEYWYAYLSPRRTDNSRKETISLVYSLLYRWSVIENSRPLEYDYSHRRCSAK